MDWLEMSKKSLLDDIIFQDKSEIVKEEDTFLEPLLDEINLIKDDAIRDFVRSVLLKSNIFWLIPSSFSNKYHPSDEHDNGGNVIHTKRVTRIANTIVDSYSLTGEEKDIILAACLIHDLTKGIMSEDSSSFNYDPMHPYTVGEFVIQCQLIDKSQGNDSVSSSLFIAEETLQTILRLVRCHLGPWSPVPETYPITYMDYIVHLADNIATNLQTYIEDSELINDKWKRSK
jgi:HD superfamily phosphohydrolase YqeK